jgi:hypothetical protein
MTQEQQQHQMGNNGTKETINSSNGVDSSLSKQLQSNLTVSEKETAPKETDSPANSRKAQKAAQKKSKKAKRREKEEQAERDEKIAAEKERQRARADRLGLSEDVDVNEPKSESTMQQSGDTKPCTTCGGSFTPGEYRAHFRSDWHRYNVKLKMKGISPVSEKEFLLCDADAFFD